jgi:hypothetical protein
MGNGFQTAILWPSLVTLAGCTAPDLDSELTAFSDTTTAALGTVEALIADEIAAERQAGRDAAIAARAPVIESGGAACGDYLTEVSSAQAADCAIRPLSRTDPNADPATALGELIEAIRAYAGAMNALAATDEPVKIGTASKSLLENAQSVKIAVAAATGKADLAAAAEPVSGIATTLADSYKLALIGRIARSTDPAMQEAVTTLATAIVERRPDFVQARDQRIEACMEVDTLRLAGADAARYGRAIARCEASQTRVATIDVESGRAAIMALGPAHAALAEAARTRVDVDAFLTFAENLDAAKSALKGKTQ